MSEPMLTYPAITLGRLLAESASAHPDWVAMTGEGIDTTYAQLEARANQSARALASLGIERGDRVAILLPNSATYVNAAYAVMKLGAIVVNVGVTTRGAALTEILRHTGAKVLVTLDIFLRGLARAIRGTDVRYVIYDAVAGTGARVDTSRFTDRPLALAALSEGQPATPPAEVAGPDDIAVLQLTGGTTRLPRAVPLTHTNILANVTQIDWAMGGAQQENGSVICLVPFFHIFGFTIGLHLSVFKGYSMVLVPRFDPLSIVPLLRLVETYRPVSFPAVPALWAVLVKHGKAYEHAVRAIQQASSGGAALPAWVQERYHEITGRWIVEAYGLSEASSTTHMTPTSQPIRPGSIGVPLPDTEAKIVDLETGVTCCASGEVGELVVRGPQVMSGTWGEDGTGETPTTLRDGWLFTGDLARCDVDGFYTIVDRKDDLIITSGFNVCPTDVEAVLEQHPAVEQAAAFGTPDRIRGQAIEALVELRDGASVDSSELDALCRASLPNHQVPRRIEVTEVIPRSPAGKPLRRLLRERRSRRR